MNEHQQVAGKDLRGRAAAALGEEAIDDVAPPSEVAASVTAGKKGKKGAGGYSPPPK